MGENSRLRARTWPYPRRIHLVRQLRKAAACWFAGRGFSGLKPSYILPRWEDWKHNIILEEVWAYVESERQAREARNEGFPLHKFVHHGLSSQAMVFNLLGPLVIDHDLLPLREAVESKGLIWHEHADTPQFEYEDRSVFNEDSGQPTSLDFVVKENQAPVLFLEAKLVESEFGGCSLFVEGDCDGGNPTSDLSRCYLHHIGRRYWELMHKHGLVDKAMRRERTCMLASHYQFFREVLFALEHNGTFIVLCDERNPAFHVEGPQGERGLVPLLRSYLPTDLQNRIGVVTVQELVSRIKQSGRHDWVAQFKSKYALEQTLCGCLGT